MQVVNSKMHWIKILLLTIVCYKMSLATLNTSNKNDAKVRLKRGIFLDAIQKIVITKNLAVDQFLDTKNTFNEAFNMLNEGFSDPVQNKPTLTPRVKDSKELNSSSSAESEGTATTTEPYRVSRYELGRILGRNYRGLKRLANIEFNDALNATKYNLAEYKSEADRQFANSLALEKKKKIKILTG